MLRRWALMGKLNDQLPQWPRQSGMTNPGSQASYCGHVMMQMLMGSYSSTSSCSQQVALLRCLLLEMLPRQRNIQGPKLGCLL